MLLAKIDGTLSRPRTTGQRASCPGCEQQMDSAVGEIVIPHWRHHSGKDCDTWADPESEWHLGWKLEAQRNGYGLEVVYPGPPLHRADAVSSRGVVVEFQRSHLSTDELLERTSFYLLHGPLIWVFDAKGWQRRWFKWKDETPGWSDRCARILDDGDHLWLADGEKVKHLDRWQVFGQPTVPIATKAYWSTWGCATCGKPAIRSFPDGSGTSGCDHPAFRELS